MPSLTMQIKPNSRLHGKILSSLRDRITASKSALENTRATSWRDAENRSEAYLPERTVDALRRIQERERGKPAYTTIQIPYSYAVLMASHTYWTTVFLSRSPVLQYTGRHGEAEQKTQAVEALMDYQMQVGEMLVPLYIWLHDAGKYGVGILGVHWEEEITRVAEIVEVEEKLLGLFTTGKKRRVKLTKQIPGYIGNKVFNTRPLDFFPDPRVSYKNFQKGEFCGQYVEFGWNTLLEWQEKGWVTNLEAIGKGEHFTSDRVEGGDALELPDVASYFHTGSDGKQTSVVSGYRVFVRLIPEKWELGKGKLPELWMFTVTSDFNLVLGAHPLGALHNKFPYFIIELEPEGYAISSRGIHEILSQISNTMDWLINSHFYNVRKTLNNQLVFDPSRIVMKDLLDPLPGGLIRVKPAAYGTDIKQYIHQLQIVDITRTHISDLKILNELGQKIVGVNDQILGAMTNTGRQTATEVRTSSAFGINRLKTQSEFFSAMGFAPMAQVLLQNTQQYYQKARAFRIVGNLAQEAPKFMDVTPDDIQGFFDFVPVDGTLPVDRFAQANLWRELMNQMRQTPQILAQYDIGRIFMWVAQLAGLKNIQQFKLQTQVVPDATLEEQARQGNVVPITAAMKEMPDFARVPEPGQVSQVGPTG